MINYSLVKLVERHSVLMLVKINPALIITDFLFQRVTDLYPQKIIRVLVSQIMNYFFRDRLAGEC